MAKEIINLRGSGQGPTDAATGATVGTTWPGSSSP